MTVLTVSTDVFACHSKACAPPPVGKGGSKGGAGGALARNAAKALKDDPDGGFTIQASNGSAITSGFAVSLKGSDKLISAKALFDTNGQPSKEFQALVQDRTAALQKALPSLPKGVQHALGGWHNPDDGKAEVNISIVFPPNQRAAAIKFAQANDQISLARLHEPFEIIATGGTGGDRS